MSKKILNLVLLMVVCIAGNVLAADYWASGVTGPWNDTWTWGSATDYPVAGDKAYLNLGSSVSIDGTAEAAAELQVGSWSGNSDLVSLSIANAGSLNVSGWTYIGAAAGDVGKLTIGSGSTFTADDALNVGYNGNGTMIVDGGGIVNADGGLFVSNPWADGTGAGLLSLLDGTVNVGTDFAMSAAGIIDIHAGTLSIYGLWYDGPLNTYIGDNWIIGYGGTQSVDLNHVGDYTVLTAVPEPATLCLLGLGGLLIRRKK